jgi:hypothetical protein
MYGSGIVDEDVQAALFGLDASDERFRLRWLTMIDRNGNPRAATCIHFGRRVAKCRFACCTTGQIDGGAEVPELPCDAAPKTAARTGNHDYLPVSHSIP